MRFDAHSLAGRLLISDGDWPADLASRGWMDRRRPELAALTRPELVRDSASAFLDAGADVLTTPTAAACAALFADGPEPPDDALQLVSSSVRASAAACRAAAGQFKAPERLVFGMVGPPGRIMQLEEVREGTLARVIESLAAALAEGGVDAIVCSAFTELDALRAAILAARETGLPVVGAMTFDCGPEWAETAMGVTPPQACEVMLEAGAAVVGCDCGQHPDSAGHTVSLLRAACSLPIWVRLHAGTPELIDGQAVYTESAESFAARLKPIVEAGATIVGGCRGASPAHVAALRAASQKLTKVKKPDLRA